MKDILSTMRTHLDGAVTSLATCWKLTREDGTEFFFTSHDQDLVIDGNTYEAAFSFDRSAIEGDSTMATGNLEIQGFFDSAALKADDLRAGLFDRAAVQIFMVNWADLSMGKIILRTGWMGEATITPSGIFRSEIRGLTQALQQNIGIIYTTQCRADLGDAACKIPVNPPVLQRNAALTLGDHYRVSDPTITIVSGTDGPSKAFRDKIFEVTTAGTTAASAPTYDYTPGNTTTDGGAVLTCKESWGRYGVVEPDGAGQQQNVWAGWPYGRDPRMFGGVNGLPEAHDTWFNDGIITWETGDNTGLSMEVQFTAAQAVVGVSVATAGSFGPTGGTAEVIGQTGDGPSKWKGTATFNGSRQVTSVVLFDPGDYTSTPTSPDTVNSTSSTNATFTLVMGTVLHLHLPMGYPFKAGDTFRVYAGCSKLVGVKPAAIQQTSVYGTFPGTSLTVVDPDGCKSKFDNAVNFRGEPFIPGADFIVGSAGFGKPATTTGGSGKK